IVQLLFLELVQRGLHRFRIQPGRGVVVGDERGVDVVERVPCGRSVAQLQLPGVRLQRELTLQQDGVGGGEIGGGIALDPEPLEGHDFAQAPRPSMMRVGGSNTRLVVGLFAGTVPRLTARKISVWPARAASSGRNFTAPSSRTNRSPA